MSVEIHHGNVLAKYAQKIKRVTSLMKDSSFEFTVYSLQQGTRK